MTAGGDSVRLTVLGRNYCHLCTDMVSGLRQLQVQFPFEIEIIDVDADPELERRYGEKVPVLVHGGEEICHFHLDCAAVADYLEKIC